MHHTLMTDYKSIVGGHSNITTSQRIGAGMAEPSRCHQGRSEQPEVEDGREGVGWSQDVGSRTRVAPQATVCGGGRGGVARSAPRGATHGRRGHGSCRHGSATPSVGRPPRDAPPDWSTGLTSVRGRGRTQRAWRRGEALPPQASSGGGLRPLTVARGEELEMGCCDGGALREGPG